MAFALIGKASSLVPVPRNADATNSRQHGMSLSLSVKKKSEKGMRKGGNAVQGLPWGRRVRAAIAACRATRTKQVVKRGVIRNIISTEQHPKTSWRCRKGAVGFGGAVDSLGSLLESVAVPEKTQACGFWLLRW